MGAEEDELDGTSIDREKGKEVEVEVNIATGRLDLVQEQVCSSKKVQQEITKADGQDSSTPKDASQEDKHVYEQPEEVNGRTLTDGAQGKENAENTKERPGFYTACEVDEQTVETSAKQTQTQQENTKVGEQNSSIFKQDDDTACEMNTKQAEQHTGEFDNVVGLAVLRKLVDKAGRVENQQEQNDTLKASENEAEVALARGLSSCDSRTWIKAMTELERWLSSNEQVDEAQLAMIWRGLFYQVWRTCNGPSVGELCKNVGRIFEALKPDMAVLVFKVLLSSLGEEWSRIDNKKLIRFRQLLQVCVRQMFKMLKTEDWKEDLTSKFIGAVGAQTESLGYALMQPFFQDLKVFVPSTTNALKTLLEPFIAVYGDNHSSVLHKVRDFVFTPLLQEARAAARSNLVDETPSLGAMVLRLSISVRFSELSSSNGLSKMNRKLVDQLHEDFKRSEKRRPSLQTLKQLQQELVVASSGEEASNDVENASEVQKEISVSGTKRKRVNADESSYVLRSMKKHQHQEEEAVSETRNETSDEEDLSSEAQRPAKRVRFSLRDNVVWSPAKPQPPPGWVTLPPCAVPRGSALKKGVLPGPVVVEQPLPAKVPKLQNGEGTSKSKSKSKRKRAKPKRKGKEKTSKRQKTR